MIKTIHVDSGAVREDQLHEAAQMLRSGFVVAYPTDTFYGLAIDPRSRDAARRLYTLKGRAEASALTLIASDLEQAEQAAVFTIVGHALARRWWPGPLTIVEDAREALAQEVLAGGRTVGIRVPDHPVARALAAAFGFCITATSANRSGEPPAVTAEQVRVALPHVDGMVDAGAAPGGAPSTIVDVHDGTAHLVRAGAIAWERVLRSIE